MNKEVSINWSIPPCLVLRFEISFIAGSVDDSRSHGVAQNRLDASTLTLEVICDHRPDLDSDIL